MGVVRTTDRVMKAASFAGGNVRLLLDPEARSGAVTLGEIVMDHESVLPMHRHLVEEAFYIIEGSAIAILGDEEHRVAAGDAVLAPASVYHGFRNESGARMRMTFFYPVVNPLSEKA